MKKLLLAGGGHGHLALLRILARHRRVDLEVVLINPSAELLYSGMLPGWMAGHYQLDQCRIDLRPLAHRAGVRLLIDTVIALHAEQRYVVLADAGRLDYDLLSLDIGSQTAVADFGSFDGSLVPVRPLDALVASWPALLEQARAAGALQLVVVGAGAAGVELAFAAHHALTTAAPAASLTLVTAAQGVLPQHAAGVRARALRCLRDRGITLESGPALGIPGGVQLASGKYLRADVIIAATGARPPAWLQASTLALDPAGFVLVGPAHASVSHPVVFAVGDVCARRDLQLQKSGVHAVHAGPVLARNLLAALAGTALEAYRPRRHSLYLLATRPGHALLSWGRFSAGGAWAWHWKDRIDRGFVARNDYSLP